MAKTRTRPPMRCNTREAMRHCLTGVRCLSACRCNARCRAGRCNPSSLFAGNKHNHRFVSRCIPFIYFLLSDLAYRRPSRAAGNPADISDLIDSNCFTSTQLFSPSSSFRPAPVHCLLEPSHAAAASTASRRRVCHQNALDPRAPLSALRAKLTYSPPTVELFYFLSSFIAV